MKYYYKFHRYKRSMQKKVWNKLNYNNQFTRYSWPFNPRPSKAVRAGDISRVYGSLRKYLIPKVKSVRKLKAKQRENLSRVLRPKFGDIGKLVSEYVY